MKLNNARSRRACINRRPYRASRRRRAVAVAAALNAPSAATALLSLVAPLMMVNIVLSATESLDGRQRLAYRDDAFEAYVAATPRLFFT